MTSARNRCDRRSTDNSAGGKATGARRYSGAKPLFERLVFLVDVVRIIMADLELQAEPKDVAGAVQRNAVTRQGPEVPIVGFVVQVLEEGDAPAHIPLDTTAIHEAADIGVLLVADAALL